ncbi:MSCRAMM family adhesin SdrC [Candidatus Gracilibacteria bacterium]|nr:MSCRAMM family adhesin SdrC [Candidatus Gracilibacteria bacterium]
MYSLSIDYIFNRIYDVLLWIKYTWFFTVLRNNPEEYIESRSSLTWDGLRDRGWFDEYFIIKNADVPPSDVHYSLWQKMFDVFGKKLTDSDGDGIPDISDSSPHDKYNVTSAQLKERYEEDYSFMDHVRDVLGIGPKDTDGDAVPDSYEIAHGTDYKNPDSDRDGLADGVELLTGTDPLNNDTDRDGVIDGRDESPLNSNITSIGPDSDSDGVSDKIETFLGTNNNSKDSDLDGIYDGMDTYPLDSDNLSQISQFDLQKSTEGLHFSIQNPVLQFFSNLLSVLSILFIVLLVYTSMRWLIVFLKSLNHYEHHFHGAHGNTSTHHNLHTIKHHKEESMPAGIANLPVYEEAPALPPTMQEFKDHPKFAVIQGYMSSTSEALWRIGIMEADNLLLEVLRGKGYRGDSVSEMLKTASFKTIDMAWDAHKIRNRIAHEGSDFELTEREAKRSFILYESVFRELKVIG